MKSFFSQLFYKYVQSNVINFFDYATPLAGLPNGFRFLRIDNLDKTLSSFFEPILTPSISLKRKYKLNNNEIAYACLLILPHVRDIVRSYLGRSASLDIVQLLMLYPEDCSNSSGLPHHDSVGHRLKLFVPLRIPGCHITATKYVLQSNKTKWKSYENPLRADNTRIDTFWEPESEVELLPLDDNLYLFDTNGIHWGDYHSISQPRVYLVMEFSNFKSYLVRGEIGYRMKTSPQIKKVLLLNNLIPPHLLLLS